MSSRLLPTIEQFEALFVNNPDLGQIKKHLSTFNPISVMGMADMEIRHSYILAWLLDPQENHGFDDVFLKAFLSETMKLGTDNDGNSPLTVSSLDIISADLGSAIVMREWQHMDIFIDCPNLKCSFIIENKWGSGEHGNQLDKYLQDANEFVERKQEKGYGVQGIYLDINDLGTNNPNYTSIGYDVILTALEYAVQEKSNSMSVQVGTFIQQYESVIMGKKEGTAQEKAIKELAAKLYREHRAVIDYIVENGASTEFQEAARDLIANIDDFDSANDCIAIGKSEFYIALPQKKHFSLLPKSWYDFFYYFVENNLEDGTWPLKHSWWWDMPVIMWIELIPTPTDREPMKGQLRLYGEVGPWKNGEARKQFCAKLQNLSEKSTSIGIDSRALSESAKFSKFFRKNTLIINDIQNKDLISKGFATLLNRFDKPIQEIEKMIFSFDWEHAAKN